LFKNIHTTEVIDIRGDVIAFARERQHYTVSHIVNICCISERMLHQIENGGSDSFYSFAIKVQVARKIGAYLKLQDKDFLVVNQATLFNEDSTEQIQSILNDVGHIQTTEKFEVKASKAPSIAAIQNNSNNVINEIDKIIGIYEESSGSKGKVPFNELLISSVEPKVQTDIYNAEKSNPITAILLSSILLGAVLLGGFYYSSEVYNYSIKALTEAGVLKKEALAVQSGEDLNSMPAQPVVEPVPSVIQPAIQPATQPATQPITQPINKSDVAR
jgi:transcriptional regulator with XRE-family HTH domain